MSSRLRGMTLLSSTILPRVQRLLETEVLKARPLWLDVVEAYPPLPPPSVPKPNRTGRSPTIQYPTEPRNGLDTSGASTPRKVTQRQPLSLFERRSVKHITQPLDGLETGAAQTTTSNHAETVSEGLLTARASAEPVAIVAEPLPQTDEKTTSVVEEEISSMTQVSPHFEDTIKSLAAMLKDYENQKPDK